MIARVRPPKPRCEYGVLPSRQMIIRRYRSLDGDRDISTFFGEGLFCKQLSEFDDQNEGLVEDAATKGGIRGSLAAGSGVKRRRYDDDIEQATDEEYLKGLKQYHRDIREQFFANCWRLGTDEHTDIWAEYTRDPERVQGCAVETTVGQFLEALPRVPVQQETRETSPDISETPIWNIAIRNPNCDVRSGACRYQKRDRDGVLQPGGSPAAVAFFKGADFAIENEFRLVFNPFKANVQLDFDERGVPQATAPSVDKIFRKLPAATCWMTNRIVLAPNAGEQEQAKLEKWLDEYNITTGSNADANLTIIDSADQADLTETHKYLAEVGGTANFDESGDYLDTIIQEFIERRDPDNWPVLDIVLLMQEKGGSIIEGYWHQDECDAFPLSAYGHDFQSVWVARLTAGDDTAELWRNANAENHDADQGTRTLDIV